MRLPSLSLRARLVLVVLAVAVVPLVLLGLWLTGQAARSGEALLVDRLERTLSEGEAAVERRWIPYRSALLDLAEPVAVRRALRTASDAPPPEALAEAVAGLDPALMEVTVTGTGGTPSWTFDRSEPVSPALFDAPLTVRQPVHGEDGRRRGTIEARIRFSALRGPTTGVGAGGGVLTARDPGTGVVLLPVPFDESLAGEPSFRWNGRRWIGRIREVAEPRVTLVAAAPLAPFVEPFEAAARRGVWILIAVAGLGVWATAWLTGRLTASLERLAGAARAVAAGDLDRTVPEAGGDDEVGQLARAFNTMVASLRRTLRELAERESLTAVNEFAASLAHEIRNPLTSIRLDLQQVEEELPSEGPLRELQAGAIEEIDRLDRTVAGALEAARSGRVEPRPTDLLEPLRAACRRATPRVEERGARLLAPEREAPLPVRGDPDALEQLFLNLLLNAAEAVAAGGEVGVRVAEAEGEATVTVADDGRGIPVAERERVFEPFYTTRAGGTGLGLAVARRIVRAHRGTIELESAPGAGTAVTVRIPRDGEPAADV